LTKSWQWRFGPAVYQNQADYPSFASSAKGRRAVGLPRRFFHYFTTDGVLRPIDSGTGIIGFGYSIVGDHVALDTGNGRVVLVRAKTRCIFSVVNSSLANFVDFLQVCESRYPYYPEKVGFDDSELAAEAIEGQLADIDPVALDPGTYWSDFISDVANGIYTG
jgi:hypothetical protein